jgi:osmotically-inducible protein OsmY
MGGGQQGFGDQSQYGQTGQMGGQAGMSRSDIAIGQQVVQQLKQQLTGIQNIQVMRPGAIYIMAVSGNVMLHGFVTNPNIKQQVSQIARAVPGVQNVTDQIRVISGAGAGTYPSYGYIPGQESQKGGGQQGAEGQNMGQQQGASGQSSRPQTQLIAAQREQMESDEQSQTGLNQSDMALARQVVQKFWQQLSGVQNIQIMMPGTIYLKVSNGTITLDGFVPDNQTKQQAEQLARSITGVQNVRNSLSIAAGGQAMGFIPADQGQSTRPDQQFRGQPSEDQSGADQPDTGIN